MIDFVTVIKKNGAIGVLAMWLWYTHNEVQDLKIRLYDCYGKTVVMKQTKQKRVLETQKFYAILPEEIKLKHEII